MTTSLQLWPWPMTGQGHNWREVVMVRLWNHLLCSRHQQINTLMSEQNNYHFTGSIFKHIFHEKNFEFWIKFHWNMFLGVQLMIHQHWFRWWLGAVQHQAIIWTNDDKVVLMMSFWCHSEKGNAMFIIIAYICDILLWNRYKILQIDVAIIFHLAPYHCLPLVW